MNQYHNAYETIVGRFMVDHVLPMESIPDLVAFASRRLDETQLREFGPWFYDQFGRIASEILIDSMMDIVLGKLIDFAEDRSC